MNVVVLAPTFLTPLTVHPIIKVMLRAVRQ